MNVTDVLVAARDALADPVCWGKGDDLEEPGRLCPLLAIGGQFDLTNTGSEMNDLYTRARVAIYRSLPGYSSDPAKCRRQGVAGYNDDPATTHADVMSLMGRAIALSEGEPS